MVADRGGRKAERRALWGAPLGDEG